MKRIYTILPLLLSFLLLMGCDNILRDQDSDNVEYPTNIEKVSESKQASLTKKYQDSNDPGFCASVNEYGLNDSEICIDREILRVEIEDHEEGRMQEMAAEFLEKNREFTNVVDADLLQIYRSSGLRGCVKCDGSEGDIKNIGWRIAYENQRYEGLEVKNTGLTVFLDSEKVYMAYGHWYRDIVVPSVDKLDFEDARQSLLGREFTYYDWTGEKNQTITEESFGEYEEKVIYPLETEQGIELRVCLAVEADIWHFYIDSTTEELVHKNQIVAF